MFTVDPVTQGKWVVIGKGSVRFEPAVANEIIRARAMCDAVEWCVKHDIMCWTPQADTISFHFDNEFTAFLLRWQ